MKVGGIKELNVKTLQQELMRALDAYTSCTNSMEVDLGLVDMSSYNISII